jgi:hypothetical protein
MMEDFAKYILLVLLVLPFAALATDALGKTQDLMVMVALVVAVISWLLALMVGGLHQRPNVANIFTLAFFVWPIFLLVAKGLNPSIAWTTVWLSVPIMSWYLVNISMQFYYPTNGGGGGLGAGLGLVAGWFYMVIPFTVLCGLFLGGRAVIRLTRGEQTGAGQPATHPVVEPKGGDKPQPEAEGRRP